MNQEMDRQSEKTGSLPRSSLVQAIVVSLVITVAAVCETKLPIANDFLAVDLIPVVIVVGLTFKILPIRRWSPSLDAVIYYFLLGCLSWVIGSFGYFWISWGMKYGFVNLDPKGFVPWCIA